MKIVKQDFTFRQHMIRGDFEYYHYRDEPSLEVEYHNHDFFEIYIFLSGKVTYVIEGKSYRLRPGDIILVNNRELHKPDIEPGQPYERIVIWVNPDFISRQSADGTNLSMCFESSSKKKYNLLRPGAEMFSVIRSIVSRLEKVCNNTGFGNSILKDVYLTELVVYLNKAYMNTFEEDIEEDIQYNEKVSNIIQYINENLGSDLSLETLSARFYMSKYHLLREFKKYVGHTLHSYIQRKRLIFAKALLKEGIQVTDVCESCGFGDYSNFIRSFKKAFGLPPKRYNKTI